MKNTDCSEIQKLDPRVRRTRKLIEDAFRALLAEHPYSEISVGEVASRATVNRATFYAHFDNREHLATSVIRADLDAALHTRLTHGLPLNAETLTGLAEALLEFFRRTVADCDAHDDVFAPTLMATLQATIQALIRRWLDLDPEAMHSFPGAKKDDVATVLAWGLYGGALDWSRNNPRPPAAEASRRLVALLIR
ncbi:MAG: TetR/AcrR family transcriptional regulator [Janthinobacterium lividum]